MGKEFKGHPALERLNLSHNALTHLNNLSRMPSLLWLDVSHNQIAYFGVFEGH